MPMLQFVGMLTLMLAAAATVVAAMLWLRTHRGAWGRAALGVPLAYSLLLLIASVARGPETLPPGTPLRFCGFYIDCHLSVSVVGVDRTPSAWVAHLQVANDARRVALAPHGLRVEVLRGDSAVLVIPEGDDLSTPIPAGGRRMVTVAFAAPANDETPALRVTEGLGVDRVIEGMLLGDDDALGRNRVRLGL